MPRGEETQEVPQEGREETNEVQEQEAKRDQEVVEAPQTVVERERPVAESEAIEREVVEAVEAVPENGGPETEDRDQAQTSEEISATPINTPCEDPEKFEDPKGDEISRPAPVGDGTSYELDKSPNDAKEDRDQAQTGEEISATPINTPYEDPEKLEDPKGEEISRPNPAGDGTSYELDKSPNDAKEDRDQAQTDEEISATPINTPYEDPEKLEDPKGDKISRPAPVGDGTRYELDKSPNDVKEDGGPKIEDRDQAALSPDDVKLGDGTPVIADHEQTPSRPLMEKELPEGGQLEESLEKGEDLQDLLDKDLDSLIPGGGEIVGADGKKVGGSKFGDDVKGLPGMDSGGKIDGSSEDPSGDQFAGKGTFKPGKGPGGGETESGGPGKNYTYTEDEANVMELITSGASKERIAAKERQLQHDAVSETLLVYGGAKKGKTQKQKPDKEDPPPKKSSQKSTPDGEEGGSDVKVVSQEEFDAVIDKVDGGQISNQDPDDQSGGLPDRLTREGAEKVKAAMDKIDLIDHTKKKAGSEVVTDPDPEDPEQGDLSKKLGL